MNARLGERAREASKTNMLALPNTVQGQALTIFLEFSDDKTWIELLLNICKYFRHKLKKKF